MKEKGNEATDATATSGGTDRSRNRLYGICVTAALALTILLSVIYARQTGMISLVYAVVAPLLVDFYVLFVLGVVALLMRVLIPEKCWNYENGCFRVREKERKIYDALRVREWKDRIPEMGKSGGFQKRRLESSEPRYLERFLRETCFAEAMHFTAGAAGFTVLLLCPVGGMVVALPLTVVNFILHALPCIVQRFTRYRLYRIYRRQKTAAATTVKN